MDVALENSGYVETTVVLENLVVEIIAIVSTIGLNPGEAHRIDRIDGILITTEPDADRKILGMGSAQCGKQSRQHEASCALHNCTSI
ncbi:hypothetical protein HUU39_12330 [candidate division KSB1 bacterium]|nr:hypothetical protein [candidate division KSB1 bacterium]